MIDVAQDGQIVTISVDDLFRLTLHDASLAIELRDVVVDVSDDDSVKVLVLRAAGAHFCARPSVRQARTAPERVLTSWNVAFGNASTLYQSLCFSKKVTITEVTGECSGAGSALVLCSDLTFADSTATFESPFAEVPEANFVLASLTMRLNRAKQWLFRPRVLSAAEAEHFGLVNSVSTPGELRDVVIRAAAAATVMPLDGITMSKMMLQAVLDGHGVGREFDQAALYELARGEVLSAPGEGGS